MKISALETTLESIRQRALDLRQCPKPVDQLSDEDKFALAFASGADIKTSFDKEKGRIIMETDICLREARCRRDTSASANEDHSKCI